MIVAGGHKISAKKVSVKTISVTFTDDIDTFTTDLVSDHCCNKHSVDRTAVIDLINMSGSSQHKKEKENQNETDMCLQHCESITTNSLKLNDQPGATRLRNGNIANHEFKVGSSIKFTSNVYSQKNITNRNSTPSMNRCNLVPNYSKTNQARRESNSLTLNHNYEKEEEEGNCIELNVYRYKGWKNSLSHNTCNATKSTLV